ncbi:HAD family hydrolase [Roseicitreum antarcticum]|uniref:phosphoglycolate phosphatase n=1 Tax=Roseicitreum antarcticum TaxID=564137 RepID=A0A1H2U4E8_9RHOB|nr:HAD family hydrolase [Roseicitreum antarcticum]SDW50469.1 phosphoglycolate phosphatase [Roseicitreum antarcticum]
MHHIKAILFDKDGTLFDFHASWAGWAEGELNALAEGDPLRRADLARAIGFDLATRGFAPDAPIIASTLQETAALMVPHLPGVALPDLIARLRSSGARAEMVPAVPLRPLMLRLRAHGLVLGIATNDAESAAHMHLDRAGISDQFDQVLGYDSGFTPKPAPDMLHAFARATGHDSAAVLMVGDSLHDLTAGRAAGMMTMAVLTGIAKAADLSPMADLLAPDIGHLPDLLGLE